MGAKRPKSLERYEFLVYVNINMSEKYADIIAGNITRTHMKHEQTILK